MNSRIIFAGRSVPTTIPMTSTIAQNTADIVHGVAWWYLKIKPIWLGIGMFIVSFIIDIMFGMLLAAFNIGLPW